MSWEDILKESIIKNELPPKAVAGEYVDPERTRAMNDWARAYTNDVLNQLRTIDDPTFGHLTIDREDQKVILGNRKRTEMDFNLFANEVKSWVRDAAHNPNKYSYATDGATLAKIPSRVVQFIRSNSTGVDDFFQYVRA